MLIAILIICLYLYFRRENQPLGRVHTKEEYDYIMKASQEQIDKAKQSEAAKLQKELSYRYNTLLGEVEEANKSYSELQMMILTDKLDAGEISQHEYEKSVDNLLDLYSTKLR